MYGDDEIQQGYRQTPLHGKLEALSTRVEASASYRVVKN
jgi:hypothetical protein